MVECSGGGDDAMADEFDVVPGWTVDAVRELGEDHAPPAGCRGSGGPAALGWLAGRMGLAAGAWLVDPMAGACRAAAALVGLPAVVGAGEDLPLADGCADAAWSVGVLCVSADQPGLLAELVRVVRPGGAVGLLVYTRRVDEVSGAPAGNDFPTPAELVDLVRAAGLLVGGTADLAEVDDAPRGWTDRQQAVEAVVARDHGHDERWRTAEDQSAAMGRLLESGEVGGTLLHARAPG